MSALGFLATRACAIAAVSSAMTVPARGQSPHADSATHVHAALRATMASEDPTVLRLLSATKEASAAFHDRRTAIAAGYRRIGPDVPSMGEHWINPRIVVADSFDVTQPALLTYIKVGGRPVLTGVVYAVPLTAGQAPPAMFGGDAMWHEHNGTLDEEALLPDHHTAPSGATGTRLAILHAWLWSPNPQGMFATDNWTIPFLRRGLEPPLELAERAGRALSLLSGAEEYYLNLAGPEASAVVMPLLSVCAKAAARIVERAQTGDRVLNGGEVAALSRAWTEAMFAVERESGHDVARRMNGGRMP